MPGFLSGQSQIRSVQWGMTHLWDIRFGGDVRGGNPPPAPFDEWFPAQDVEEPIFQLETLTIEGGNSTFEIPKGTASRELNITFFENEARALAEWFNEWVNFFILGDDAAATFAGASTLGFGIRATHVAELEQAVRRVDILKLDSRREPVKTSSYLVFPKGQMTDRMTADAGPISYSAPFVIAGR